MSVFATSHCRLAFPIFRTSTGFSVAALAIRRKASAHIPVWAARRAVSLKVRIPRHRAEIDDAREQKVRPGSVRPGSSARKLTEGRRNNGAT